jgi:outer membrane protein
VDVLNAEQQLGSARRDLAQARFTYLLSVVRLRSLAGDLMDATISEVNQWLLAPAPLAREPIVSEANLRMKLSTSLSR